ncbi:MAG TPA: agmatine deiminase family protein [Acidimicrobiia bacterium]|jgi:agmatine deiminase|nr:agmatine deiminase family protein [Acidimicrobiia bacterium]
MTWRMPAEWEDHERCVMAWPARADMWQSQLTTAKHEYASVARAVSRTEPVLMIAPPGAGTEASTLCGDIDVEVVEWPIDDSWTRDMGAIVVHDGAQRAGVDFVFNSWGEKFVPYEKDAQFARRMCEAFGLERIDAAPFVLEGGAITVDGEGTLVTTEQCLLNPNRNPDLSKEQIEAELCRWLGVERVVWLPHGILEDDDTDGHVDNVCAFVAPGRVIAQTTSDRDDANHERLQRNVDVLKAAGLDVVELDVLVRTTVDGDPVVVPPLNAYLANDAVIVPVVDADSGTRRALDIWQDAFPAREITGVPGQTLAYGGGGVHCITQQVPR